MYLSKGNKKLSQEILIWSIPAVKTCPNCSDCKDHCYARKAERVYPEVLPCRTRNWNASLSDNFVQDMVKLIKSKQKHAKRHHPRAVRIHESGDFYSKEYAQKWAEIARQCPDLVFFGYTKVPENLPDNIPENMNIVHSTIGGEINFGDKEYVLSYAKKNRATICPYGKAKRPFICGEDCKACMKKERVVFLKH